MYNDTFNSFSKKESHELANDMDFISLSRRGVSKRTLERLLELSGMALTQLSQLLSISKQTIQRYDKHKKFFRRFQNI